jgi:hypothetical protein
MKINDNTTEENRNWRKISNYVVTNTKITKGHEVSVSSKLQAICNYLIPEYSVVASTNNSRI